MADPLSIAAGIIAVLQASSVMIQGAEKVYTALHAERHVQQLRRDLQDLATAVSVLHSHLTEHPHMRPQAAELLLSKLQQTQIVVQRLDKFIRHTLTESRTGRAKKRAFLWQSINGKIERYCEQLNVAMQSLSFASIVGL